MIKTFRRLCLAIFFLLIAMLAMIVFVVTTPSGTAFAFGVAEIYLNNQLKIGEVQGRLLDSLQLKNITYHSRTIHIDAEQLDLHWQAFALLNGKIIVDAINIQHAEVSIEKSASQEKKSDQYNGNIFSWPVHIQQLHLVDIRLRYADNDPIEIQDLIAELQVAHEIFLDVKMQLLNPAKLNSQLQISGSVDNYQWQLALQNQQTSWLANGVGNKNGITIKTADNQLLDGQLSLNGEFHWLPKTNWDLLIQAKSLNLFSLNKNAPKDLNFHIITKGNSQVFDIDALAQWEKNLLKIQGNVSKQWNLHYTLNLPNIETFEPSLRGVANLTGAIKGNYLHPKIDGNLLIKQLQYIENQDATHQPRLENIKSDFLIDIDLSENAKPKILGSLALKSDRLIVPKLNRQFEDLNVHAKYENNVVNYTGSIRSDQNTLQLNGKTWDENNFYRTTLSLTGKDFLISNTKQLKLYLSPELKIEDKKDGWHVNGKIYLPTANIKLTDMTKTVTLPPETTIIKASGEIQQEESLPIFADIFLTLGDNVYLEASGLKSKVAGDLQIKDSPDKETFANGRLSLINGTYNLQGQILKIDEGAFIFLNTLITNPSLNIRATKTIHYAATEKTFAQQQTFLVGLKITGTAENPQVVLFSDPAGWSQPDILSLIVLGQPASTASSANMGLLVAAANALTPQNQTGVSQMTHKLQEFFGLSEFGVESEVSEDQDASKQGTSFVLGKYLSPRLYVNYSLSVLNSVNTLRLRYLLTKNWFIQTQANTLGTGIDILYSISRE